MSVQPIVALCRRCRGEFTLAELVEDQTGLCPRCQWVLAPDWVPALLAEARRAEHAQLALVESLHRLVSLPGNLEVALPSILKNLLEEVSWDRELADDAALRDATLRYLAHQAARWGDAAGDGRHAAPRPLLAKVRDLTRGRRRAPSGDEWTRDRTG